MSSAALVDLHSHILPGVDDGARDDAEALEMLRIAEADGIQRIVATPHSEYASAAEITEGVAYVAHLAASNEITIDILPGCEVFIAPDLVEQHRAGELATLNGTHYVLLELPLAGEWPIYLQTTIYDLQVAGLTPILAHAERYRPVQNDTDILLDLISTGVIVQVNASSLIGRGGSRSQRAAETLVQRRMAHVIASDAHSSRGRSPRIREALSLAAELAGPDYATDLQHRAAQILQGDPVTLPDPLDTPKPQTLASRFRRLLSRG